MDINLENGGVGRRYRSKPAPYRTRSAEIQSIDQPVRIRTLGRFSIQLHSRAVELPQPRQQKPYTLLQALIACGGRDVHSEILAQLVWPDSDGDSAQNSFDVTLHRLRRRFPIDDLFVLRDRRLSLNSRTVWVDAWTFERLVNHGDRLLQGIPDAAVSRQLARIGERLLTIYQGAFLEREAAQHWMLSMRERLRSKLMRFFIDASGYWISVRDWNLAIRFCQKGLEIEPLAEQLYRQLIVSFREAGQRSEAVACFHRCRRLLAEQLQVAPAAETVQLYQSLKA